MYPAAASASGSLFPVGQLWLVCVQVLTLVVRCSPFVRYNHSGALLAFEATIPRTANQNQSFIN